MKVSAELNHLRISPRKVRLLTKLIVGMGVERALSELEFRGKRAAMPVMKLLKSAVANAEHNFQLKRNSLIVKEAVVNQGPVMKRMMPRAMGRGATIRKRTSNIRIILESSEGAAAKTKGKKKKESEK
jgi:large subunit ribosomal protein L22